MKPLFLKEEAQRILEHGLLEGLWSIAQFQGGPKAVLPSREFLEKHPQFQTITHRDLNAYRTRQERANAAGPIPGVSTSADATPWGGG